MAMDKEREALVRGQFERWITAPPFEKNIRRYSEKSSEWPGCYRDYAVHLAWDAWQAALTAQQEPVALGDLPQSPKVEGLHPLDALNKVWSYAYACRGVAIRALHTAPPSGVREGMLQWRELSDVPERTGRYIVAHRGGTGGHAYYTAKEGDTHYPVGWSQLPGFNETHWIDPPVTRAAEQVNAEWMRDLGRSPETALEIEQAAIIRELKSQPTDGVVVPREPIMGQWDDFCAAARVTVPFEAFRRGYAALLAAAKEP